MSRRPLLPQRMTGALAFVGGLVVWALASYGAGSFLPDPVAITLGILLGLLAMMAIPIALGRPKTSVILLIAVGGLAVLIGFTTGIDRLGIGMALAIYVPMIALIVLLVWAMNRYVIPAVTREGGTH